MKIEKKSPSLFFIPFILCLFVSTTFAQSDSTRHKWRLNDKVVKSNVICGEILGGNVGLSVNYERAIINKKHFLLNARVGLGTLLVMWSATYSISGNFGGKNNFLEMGFGRADYSVLVPGVYGNGPSSFYYPLIGYRYQKNFLFKFQILGLIEHRNNQLTSNGTNLPVIFGVSFGKAF
jgi:hypothetical protein